MESHDSEFARAGGYGLPAREDAMKAGHDEAVATITRQADAGMMPEQIAEHQHDVSAWLLSEATTEDAQSFAAGYDSAAQALAADLMASVREATAAPMAARLPDGTPHSDPVLRAKGWHARGGLYVRRPPDALADREAC